MTTTESDLEEAKELIRRAVMTTTRGHRRVAKDKAAAQLLEELLQLNGFCEIEVQRHEGHQVAITLNRATAFVTYNKDDSTLRVIRDGGTTEVELELDLDPEKKLFLGTTLDEFRTPIPGQAQRRRPATAVVVEAVLSLLFSKHK